MRFRVLALISICLVILTPANGQQIPTLPAKATLVKAGRVLDVKSGQYLANQGILVEGATIKQVGAFESVHAAAPKDALLLDLSNATILPGLIDCHAHPMLAMDPNMNGADAIIANLSKYSPTKRVLLGAELAREYLNAGFTTIRSVGHTGIDGDVSLRDAIRLGWVVGPRIVPSGRKITPFRGQVVGIQPGLLDAMIDEDFLVATNPEEGRSAVIDNLRVDAQWIKVIADEWPVTMDVDTMNAIVAETHRAGRKVAVHATSKPGIQVAIDAGVDSIEHADEGTDAQFEVMQRKGIVLVATIHPPEFLPSVATATNPQPGPRQNPEEFRKGLIASEKAMLARARKAGVKIVFGSDEVFTWKDMTRGEAARRYLEALPSYGFTSVDALRAATISAAELLDSQSVIGSIETGKYADMIALEGDPLTDLKDLEKVRFVMKGGAVIRDDFHPDNPAGAGE